ncbi:hypothetical protein P175DRAFT_0437190 [Aspergillus ochraceoroseus IBT 24754]|nr:uncharacterized protein P175DRAFT_0437190 [Aspergillus ochraceoroseus IBT 24754]PTU21237.1 hypothetical protein P175DRAFT_0437190 [Aspergillus ochraceoroseus IBT 24754]
MKATLATLPTSFFRAVDNRDIDAVLAHFSPDATFTVQTDNVTYTGESEIRAMFTKLINSAQTISHEVTGTVVDLARGRIATEQRFTVQYADGTSTETCNGSFFDVGQDGKFTRFVVWMSGVNPVK